MHKQSAAAAEDWSPEPECVERHHQPAGRRPRGKTLTRGFAGVAGGKNVVVFVAKEGPYQGRVLSSVVPDANQMSQWGLL